MQHICGITNGCFFFVCCTGFRSTACSLFAAGGWAMLASTWCVHELSHPQPQVHVSVPYSFPLYARVRVHPGGRLAGYNRLSSLCVRSSFRVLRESYCNVLLFK